MSNNKVMTVNAFGMKNAAEMNIIYCAGITSADIAESRLNPVG